MAVRCLLKLVPVAVPLAAADRSGFGLRHTEAELRHLGLAEAEVWMNGVEPSPAHVELAEHLVHFLLPVPPEFQAAATQKEHQFMAFAGRRQAPLGGLDEVEKEQIPALPDTDATPNYSRQEHKVLVADFWELLFLLGAAFCFAAIYYGRSKDASAELLGDVRSEDPDSFRQWRHSWYSCYSAPCGTNATACLCPCVRWSETLSFVRPFPSFWLLFCLFGAVWALSRLGWFSLWGYLLMVMVCVYYRQNLRQQYDMERGGGTYCSDCCLYSLCSCCAIVQEARHVDESHLAHHQALGGPMMVKPRQQPMPAPAALSPRPVPTQTHVLRAPHYEEPQPHVFRAPEPPPHVLRAPQYEEPWKPPTITNLSKPPSTANLSPQYNLPGSGGATVTQPPLGSSHMPSSTTSLQAQEYEVTVPPGMYGGDTVRLAVGAGEVEVTVPAGLVPGQLFRIRV